MYGPIQKKSKFYAYAKINLSLEILGQLSNGYHEISSLAQTISLADQITFEPEKKIIIVGSITSNIKNDLIYQAAILLKELLVFFVFHHVISNLKLKYLLISTTKAYLMAL